MFSFAANILSNSATNIKKKKGKSETIKENWSFPVFKNSSKGKKETCLMECFVMAKETKYWILYVKVDKFLLGCL